MGKLIDTSFFANIALVFASRVLALGTVLLVTSCTFSPTREIASDQPATTPENEILATADLTAPDINIFELDAFLQDLLDNNIKPIKNRHQRFQQLHDLFYETWNYNLRYYEHLTLNAKDTFYAGGGNCIALSSLFVAAARHVGLKARFQTVEVERDWFPREDYFEIPGHVNVVVDLGSEQATVEFNQAFFDQHPNKRFKRRIISDNQAKALFYNNLGVDKFSQKEYREALAYFDKALQHHAKIDFIWSNRGVVLKRLNQFDAAEQSYLHALAIDPNNPSSISNIYLFYRDQGNATKQASYREKALRYAQKNPWYLAEKAEQALAELQLTDALALINKALKIKKDASEFHQLQARIHLQADERKRARKAAQKALEYAKTEGEERQAKQIINSISSPEKTRESAQ